MESFDNPTGAPVIDTKVRGGPWGPAMDVLLCLLPIIFLLVATLKPRPLPTTASLPLSAACMWVVRLAYLEADALEVTAQALAGVLDALTPLSIVAGSIFLFESMESTNCVFWMRERMRELTSGHHVAEIMLIGFCFSYTIEGASGFGTPVALASPMLVSLGHSKFATVVCLLLLNTFCATFGAVGTPIWFGLGVTVNHDEALLRQIGLYSAIGLAVSALLLVPPILTFLVPRGEVRRNLVFVVLSTASCCVPSVAISLFSYDFPTLVGCARTEATWTVAARGEVGFVCAPVDQRRHCLRAPCSVGRGSARRARSPALRRPATTTRSRRHASRASCARAPTFKPRLGSGVVGMVVTGLLVRFRVGMCAQPPPPPGHADGEHAHDGDAAAEHHHASPIMPKGGSASHEQAHSEHVALELAALRPARSASGAAASAPVVLQITPVSPERPAHAAPPPPAAADHAEPRSPELCARLRAETGARAALLRTSPLTLTVLILVLTRIDEVGLKPRLTDATHRYFTLRLGSLGSLWLARSGVVGVERLMGVDSVSWSYALLYVPFVLPFVLAALPALVAYRDERVSSPLAIARKTAARLQEPTVSLFGALALVGMLRGRADDEGAPAHVVGNILSAALGHSWIVFAAPIGALGSFFSGSATVSNLTFGSIQYAAALRLRVHAPAMLALQAIGGSIGHAVCLNNIIAAPTVVGLKTSEGAVMRRTLPVVAAYWVICTLTLVPFIYGVHTTPEGAA